MDEKVLWKKESKIGSVMHENAHHVPGGGDVEVSFLLVLVKTESCNKNLRYLINKLMTKLFHVNLK